MAKYNYPQNMIVATDAACPSGWTRIAAADNLLITAGATYGLTGSSASHTHTVPERSATSGYASLSNDLALLGSDFQHSRISHRHDFTRAAGVTSSTTPTPPYIKVILCVKN